MHAKDNEKLELFGEISITKIDKSILFITYPPSTILLDLTSKRISRLVS